MMLQYLENHRQEQTQTQSKANIDQYELSSKDRVNVSSLLL